MTNPERILDCLSAHPEGLTDGDILRLTGIAPHQQVNQIARRLQAQGILTREKDPGRGKIVNRLLNPEVPLPVGAEPAPRHDSSSAFPILGEDDVKKAVSDHLTRDGWMVTVKWGRKHGADIEAVLGDRVLIIEAKGEVNLQPQMVNYFLGALGELLQRMDAPGKEYGLALPRHGTYLGLVDRLPLWVKHHLKLQFFLVSRDGDTLVVDHQSY